MLFTHVGLEGGWEGPHLPPYNFPAFIIDFAYYKSIQVLMPYYLVGGCQNLPPYIFLASLIYSAYNKSILISMAYYPTALDNEQSYVENI